MQLREPGRCGDHAGVKHVPRMKTMMHEPQHPHGSLALCLTPNRIIDIYADLCIYERGSWEGVETGTKAAAAGLPVLCTCDVTSLC